MTLLTIEEIEKYERHCTGKNAVQMSEDSIKAFIATARAYCELMDKLKKNIPMLRQWLNEDRKANPLVHSHDIAQWLEVPMEFKGYMSNADEQKIIDAVKPEDKPHPATLKVIEGYNQEKNIIAQILITTKDHYQRGGASSRLKEIDKAISNLLDQPLKNETP